MLLEFSTTFSGTPGTTEAAEISIDTGTHPPISSPPYRIPHGRMAAARQEVQKMLTADIIEPSAWAAPMLLVGKKDGTLRPVIDFRKINNHHPRPFPHAKGG